MMLTEISDSVNGQRSVWGTRPDTTLDSGRVALPRAVFLGGIYGKTVHDLGWQNLFMSVWQIIFAAERFLTSESKSYDSI